MDEPPCQKVTHMRPGASPLGPVTDYEYNLIDLMLCESLRLDRIQYCHSAREAALRSDHYLVQFGVQTDASVQSRARRKYVCRESLMVESTRESFFDAFCEQAETTQAQCGTLDERRAKLLPPSGLLKKCCQCDAAHRTHHGLARTQWR